MGLVWGLGDSGRDWQLRRVRRGKGGGLPFRGLEVDPALASALISMVEICTTVK